MELKFIDSDIFFLLAFSMTRCVQYIEYGYFVSFHVQRKTLFLFHLFHKVETNVWTLGAKPWHIYNQFSFSSFWQYASPSFSDVSEDYDGPRCAQNIFIFKEIILNFIESVLSQRKCRSFFTFSPTFSCIVKHLS